MNSVMPHCASSARDRACRAAAWAAARCRRCPPLSAFRSSSFTSLEVQSNRYSQLRWKLAMVQETHAASHAVLKVQQTLQRPP